MKKLLIGSIFLVFSSVSYGNEWTYSANSNEAVMLLSSSTMASVNIIKNKPYFMITDLSGTVGCGYGDNPAPSLEDVEVNGNKAKFQSFCQSYQRVYTPITREQQDWVMGGLYNGHDINIKIKANNLNVRSNNFKNSIMELIS